MKRDPVEWPTWFALIGMHGAWVAGLWAYGAAGLWICPVLAVIVAFHSSLQHEALHGHPTRSAALNEALVSLPVGWVIPYRSFRDLHIRHHNDARLTDPYDDPETWYLAEGDWDHLSLPMRALLRMNATLAGRVTVGPWLMTHGFLRAELRAMAVGNKRVMGAWGRHILGLIPVIAAIWAAGIPLWVYALGVVWPALSLLAVRTYIEHRAAHCPKQRSAIVEAGWFWSLLFLNNNLHRVHHERPAVAWYKLPAIWRAERARVLAENGGYYFPGYWEVARQWFITQREPVIHPSMRRRG
ncbi:MAG: fatty acid desaturase [Pseudomonadota bacterium]